MTCDSNVCMSHTASTVVRWPIRSLTHVSSRRTFRQRIHPHKRHPADSLPYTLLRRKRNNG